MTTLTKLLVYNNALLMLGERPIASLTEARESRRVLDAIWDHNSYDTWLEKSDWNFAMRSASIAKDAAFVSSWGPDNAFQNPTDMARLSGIYTDEAMKVPLRDYLDEGLYWFADSVDTIYVQYVSNDASYGGDLCLWPQSFAEYVAAFLALKAAPTLKNDVDAESLKRQMKSYLNDAKSKDGLRSPSKPLPQGSWTRSRLLGTNRE